jgi:hypothetical protein
VVFDKVEGQNIGDFVTVFVEDCTQGTLWGKLFNITLSKFLRSKRIFDKVLNFLNQIL